MKVDIPRETALKILYDINEKDAYSNIAINKYLERTELRELDRGFITELVYGTVKWRLSIDWIIQQYSKVRLKKLSPWILNVLRLGIYQLLYTDRIPESAAVNESVALAKKYGHSAASGFVNAVLRNVARNKENMKYPDAGSSLLQYLSVKYSHPEWMVRTWLERYGREFTESLLDANNMVPDFTVRVNTLKTDVNSLVEKLKQAGIDATPGKFIEEAVIIKNPSSISRLEAFKEGLFQVQDESSMLVGKVLDPKPGELVMDVCSAPGGKATHIAQIMKNKGTVVARDVHEHKIKLIDDAARRLGLNIVKTEVYNALFQDEAYTGRADRVLVDAPCTGFGIIRKKPDIKWGKNIEDKREITGLQKKILNSAALYVKKGGTLVYSTCTFEPEENEYVIKDFLENNREFDAVDISVYIPEKLDKPSARDGCLQLYPNVEGIDGFFISRMARKQ